MRHHGLQEIGLVKEPEIWRRRQALQQAPSRVAVRVGVAQGVKPGSGHNLAGPTPSIENVHTRMIHTGSPFRSHRRLMEYDRRHLEYDLLKFIIQYKVI